jgi:hypothetical protein
MMSLTNLFDDDFNEPFDSFMLTVEDMLEGRELSAQQDIDALCDKLIESSTNFGGEISRLFESFADLFEKERGSCSASECRKLKARVDRIARMRRNMAQSEKYKPDFAGFPQNPHSGLAEKAGEEDLMAIRRQKKFNQKMLRGPLQEWKEEQLLSDDVEHRLRDKEYKDQISGIASTEQDRSKRSQSKSRSECNGASSKVRNRSGCRGRSRSGSRGRSVEHGRSRSRSRSHADCTSASPRKATGSSRGSQLANENSETEHVGNTRRRGRSLSRREQDNTTKISGIQLEDATTEHAANTLRRGRSLSRRELGNTDVSPASRRGGHQAMGGTEAVQASPRRRDRSASRRRERSSSTDGFHAEHLARPRRRRRSVSRHAKEKPNGPAASSEKLTMSKSVSQRLQLPCSKSSQSDDSSEFSVINKGSTKEIRDKVRSCSQSKSRSRSPGSNKPSCHSPRKGRRERVAMEPSMTILTPKTPSRKLEPKLDKLKLSGHILDPSSPNSTVQNSIRTNQTWDPSMGRSPAADLTPNLTSSSQSLVLESPRRRQQAAIRRPRLISRDSGESVREVRRRKRESKTEQQGKTRLCNDLEVSRT